MTPQKEINIMRAKIAGLIDARRLGDAIREIKDKARGNAVWGAADKAEQAEQAYAYMLRYVAQGVADPGRAAVYGSIVNDLYSALDSIVFALEKKENPSLYYSTIRTAELSGAASIESIVDQCERLADGMSIFSLVASGAASSDEAKKRHELEQAQSELFKRIWTSPSLSAGEAERLGAALSGQALPPEAKAHIASALMLALIQRFDTRKLELLMAAYMGGGSVEVTSAALVGMLIALWLYRSRPLPKQLADRLAAAKEGGSWASDLRIAFIELIRARDTERINRKIRDEVLPDMMNLRPEIMDKIAGGKINPSDFSSLEENPDWQEMLDKSGVADKLKELTEIQMEGGDVMMSTFAHLKSFPFFSDIANWFLPFSAADTRVADAARRLGVMGEMIEQSSFMCDSDKYSFMFAIEMVPQEQRQMMASQFQAQSDNIYEAMGQGGSQTAPENRRRAVNLYVQNIYRFFKLFSRRGEFFDPFDSGVNLISAPVLAEDFEDPELLRVVAEFYFKLGYMRDALDVFEKLQAVQADAADAALYQKMGYCAEHLRDYALAIRHYDRASLLDSDSKWTAKRLAACLRAAGEKDRALQCYAKLAEACPDDMSIALLYGYALTEKGKYDRAVNEFYKVEFMDEKSQRAWRPLAWTLFLTRDFENSMKYYERIIAGKPKPSDYLNMGHVALAMGDTRNAVNSYRLAIEANGGDREAFLKSLADDAPYLAEAGVDKTLIPIVADAV